MPVPSDNPIDSRIDDLLGRDGVAASIARNIRSVDSAEGYVIGVLGPWGFGKTSLINLVRENLAEDPELPVIDFNPWLFSGADQLLQSFFSELASQLRVKGEKLSKVAGNLDTYSIMLTPLSALPFVGAWADRTQQATKTLREYTEARRESVYTRRATLTKLLKDLTHPIVVVIDDIDRLTTPEIREVFKLVRLTASFPNVIYVLAFDRGRVENALSDDGLSGRDYLEKILQTAIDIPEVPRRALLTALGVALDETIEATGASVRFDEQRWPDVLAEVVWPLIRNLRDVRRLSNSIYAAVTELQDEIELVDVLALEAIRVFMPDLFEILYDADTELTQVEYGFSARPTEAAIAKVKRLLDVAEREGRREIAVALIGRLFPAASRHIGSASYDAGFANVWLRARRVAHKDILDRYLERFAGEGLHAFHAGERLFGAIADRSMFDALLRAIPVDQREDAIAALEVYEKDFPEEAAEPVSTVLLNILPSLPARPRGMLSLVDAKMVVTRVIFRLLRNLEPDVVERVVGGALTQIDNLSGQLQLLTIVGHREGAGHKLMPELTYNELLGEWAQHVVTTPPEELAGESDLLMILNEASKVGQDSSSILAAGGPMLTRSLLKAAKTESRRQVLGNRSVVRSIMLPWELLIKLFSGQERLRDSVDATRGLPDNDDEYIALLALADKYLGGWRDETFGDPELDES